MKKFDVTITSPQGIIRLPNIEYIETDKNSIYLRINHNEYIVYDISDEDVKINETLVNEESRRIVFNFSEKPTVNSSRRRLEDR